MSDPEGGDEREIEVTGVIGAVHELEIEEGEESATGNEQKHESRSPVREGESGQQRDRKSEWRQDEPPAGQRTDGRRGPPAVGQLPERK